MISLPGAAARSFAALLRRLSARRARDAPPFAALRQGPDGQSLTAWRGAVGLRWHRPGAFPPAGVAFAADHLAGFGPAADVTIAPAGPAHAGARWGDRGTGQARRIPTIDPGRVPPFPPPAGRMAAQPPAFLTALADAGRTAAKEDARFALSRVLLRGKAGQVVATDGKQLLACGGFTLPWADDVLVPAAPVFGAKELSAAGAAAAGRAAGHVLVAAGPWTIALKADAGGRFPPFEGVIPRGPPAARCDLDPADVPGLVAGIFARPGDEPDGAVTLDFGGRLTVRAAAGGGVREVTAVRSTTTGDARVACDRQYLLRALRLGLTRIDSAGPGKPLAARGGPRTYVWMALDEATVVPPAVTSSPTPTPLPEAPMPPPNPNGHPPPGRPPGDAGPPTDLLAGAEAVRGLLADAAARLGTLIAALRRQKKQSRALLQAAEALRQLPPLGP